MKTRKLLKGREITNGYVVIVFSFASDWLGGWHKFFRSDHKANPGDQLEQKFTLSFAYENST